MYFLANEIFFGLRNTTTKYMRWESTLSSLKKYQELNVSPRYETDQKRWL